MNNREVARVFNKLAKVMELHKENPFKTRSYSSAYNTIRRYHEDVISLSHDRLMEIQGIGKNIADKIIELRETGKLATLQKYLDQTPPGIVQMLDVKGLGAKKILAIWKDLEVETPGELLYACKENRLVELKGFGAKTQSSIEKQLEYYLDSQGYYLYGHIEAEAEELEALLQEEFADDEIAICDEVRRKMPVVSGITILTTAASPEVITYIELLDGAERIEEFLAYKGTRIDVEEVDAGEFHRELFYRSASEDFIASWEEKYGDIDIVDEDQLFEEAGLPWIAPECREIEVFDTEVYGEVIETNEIKGVIHTHTVWSDGAATVAQMAEECKKLGYEYLLITDHSKSAGYAGGLSRDRVLAQMDEIDAVNTSMEDFTIFKGIESDILSDGSLDYDNDTLDRFDVVIASVHSNLKMDQEKAHMRLLNAIAHPATKILGHLTGRLLLSRPGYEVDHKLIIDACAEHDVVIELNASPYRLDIDWTWIPYALEKSVMISINPDAHSLSGIQDIQYGVAAARKALLPTSMCLNAKNQLEFENWIRR